jgi:prolyl oligopeptidase
MSKAIQSPPHSPTEAVTDLLHGVDVTDPYRWLEEQKSPQTRAWLAAQTDYARSYMDEIPGRDRMRERVAELLARKEVISQIWNVGDRYFYLKRLEDKEQPVIVARNGLLGGETILVDPASRAAGTSTAVAIVAISRNARFLAYSVRYAGTDYSALEILDLELGLALPDGLPEGFCTGIAFAPDNSGFYYSHRKVDDARPNYRGIFWHRFGTTQLEDQLIFFAGEKPNLFLGILASPEAKLLAYVVFSADKDRSTSIYLDYMSTGTSPKLLLHNIEGCFVPFFVREHLLAYTDLATPNFRIVSIDVANPDPSHWRDVVPESRLRIQQFSVAGDQVFVSRVNRFSTEIEAFGLDGTRREDTAFPPRGTIDLLSSTNGSKLFFNYTSISTPTTTFCYDEQDRDLVVWEEASVAFDSSVIASEEVIYCARDGTAIPLFLAARKDLLHSGPLPTFLTGYGGFGICVTPRFTVFTTSLIEHGFLLAVPAIRGGSELGEQWHVAGKRGKRQKSFDDFLDAAEWLLSQGRSARGRLSIGGGSNAGLLVGAAITQRPDLFRAAICLGPLLDMTRYHLFDQAARWADEYGSPEDAQDFHSLLAYSPYHRVRNDASYPAVLLISGDADTRCNPMHARKMTARLQAASTSGHPILLHYNPDWGHTPVQPLSTKIDALTDRLAFICHELGVAIRPRRFS